ncbi:MAG: hypothetical protein WKG01_15030 [Kofleriaceae bacterium]
MATCLPSTARIRGYRSRHPRCWPPQREVGIRSALLVHPIDLGDMSIGLPDCITALETRFDTMRTADQAAWREVWRFLDGLAWADDYTEEPVVDFDAATLLVALDALSGNDDTCAMFAEAVRALALPPGATVGIQRYWTG